MTVYHWLSFADPKRPEGSQFLGGGLFEGEDFLEAVATASRLGENPGGEAVGWGPIQAELVPSYQVINRLQSPEEIGANGMVWVNVGQGIVPEGA